MYRSSAPRRTFSKADFLILFMTGAVIAGLSSFGQEWSRDFSTSTEIDLSLSSLPLYAAFSAMRGLLAYGLSLVFTLIVGYWAANSRAAEKILIPLLDILQSIPVLGFLPGLVLGLIALFPKSNVGLELAAIVMIFTGQVWNMTFSYYSSLKSIPGDLKEASTVMALARRDRLAFLELPYAATGLAWNSLMSMAGGWFFLSVCEAFSLGDRSYRLPGLGAYMAEAITSGNTQAMVWGIVAMVAVIVGLDFFIWSPVLAWVQRFRLEDIPGGRSETPFMLSLYQDSLLFQTLQNLGKRRRRARFGRFVTAPLSRIKWVKPQPERMQSSWAVKLILKIVVWVFALGALYLTAVGTLKLGHLLWHVSLTNWLLIARDTLWTLLRVFVTLVLSSLWTVPVGIYLATSQRRLKFAQPVIQVLASFPAPMLYPLALTIFFKVHLSFEIASLFLMMLGVQWYVLFNVLAGAMKFPSEVRAALKLMNTSVWDRWRYLYIPCVFPSLVTGWITAAGGAWNASIVAEFVSFRHQTLIAQGIGARISVAASQQDFSLLAASLTVMVFVVIALNRGFWSRIYHIAQTRFRMDL